MNTNINYRIVNNNCNYIENNNIQSGAGSRKINIKKSKIVFLGCGAVSKACLYYFDQFFDFKYDNIHIIEMVDSEKNFPSVIEVLKKGAHFHNETITYDNPEEIIFKKLSLSKNDIIIDLSTRTPTYIIFKLCRLNGIFYINTSIEDYYDESPASINQQQLHLFDIFNITKEYGNRTSLIEYGMNPGLISSFTKKGIMDMTNEVIKKSTNFDLKKQLKSIVKKYKNKKDNTIYKYLAEALKIRVIHCSEIDTIKSNKKLDIGKKIYNTWSCIGLVDEGDEPAEIVLGKHEDFIPFDQDEFTCNMTDMLMTKKKGKDILCKSIVPLKVNKDDSVSFTNITGRVIHHGEGCSLRRYLSTHSYSPTMHYVYRTNKLTEHYLSLPTAELKEITAKRDNWVVLNMYEHDLIGNDNVGAHFILENNPFTNEKSDISNNNLYSWWSGTILDTDYTKNILKDKYFSPTIIQVMSGLLSGLSWMISNPDKGLCFGEDVDQNYIFNLCGHYLGKIYSGPTNIKPSGSTLKELLILNKNDQNKSSEFYHI
jgi:homospermidine synthase